ncbi:MAG: hypothetical protein J6K03_08570 [Oscillospiraceae bacterium]|nr:hypothetical protein [Oscillospiraceae bacterium]
MEQQPNFSAEDVKKIAQSKAGQDLYALLQQTQSQQLKDAMAQAAAGDMEQVKKTVSAMMASPEAKALLDQLRR